VLFTPLSTLRSCYDDLDLSVTISGPHRSGLNLGDV
jgi:hypothetical protein